MIWGGDDREVRRQKQRMGREADETEMMFADLEAGVTG